MHEVRQKIYVCICIQGARVVKWKLAGFIIQRLWVWVLLWPMCCEPGKITLPCLLYWLEWYCMLSGGMLQSKCSSAVQGMASFHEAKWLGWFPDGSGNGRCFDEIDFGKVLCKDLLAVLLAYISCTILFGLFVCWLFFCLFFTSFLTYILNFGHESRIMEKNHGATSWRLKDWKWRLKS